MSRVNLHTAEPDDVREKPGFAASRARLSERLGSQRLGATLWVLPPGEAIGPYHYHLVEEELLVVLEGSPSIRMPEGWRELEAGDVVSFRVGPDSAHQIANRSAGPARVLFVATRGDPDAVVYPDTARVGVIARPTEPGGVRGFFRLADDAGFWDDEVPPSRAPR
jgi:uncharacterized cupin superfamily protein